MIEEPIFSADSALFLDFDGTLVDLAPRPEAVDVADGLIPALEYLQDRLAGAVAVISGRPVAEIDGFLSPLRLPSAGLHGLELRAVQGGVVRRDPPGADIEKLKKIIKASGLIEQGVYLEDKGVALAAHYRAVPDQMSAVQELMARSVRDLPSLHLVSGKMVVEAKPSSRDKGKAVLEFMTHAPFAGRRPVFVGDDVTDEDGIAAVQALGGIGIKVGTGPSCARFRLPDVAAVHSWLAGPGPNLEC